MVSRRDVLHGFGVSTTLGLAGCSGLVSGESSDQTGTPDAATPTRTPTATLAPERTFGRQVALDGDTAVVAAIESEEPGRVYVFERTGDGWTERDSFPGAQGADGAEATGTVAIQGDTALVGNPRDDTAGEAVRLERGDDGWERTERFVGDSRDPADRFGASVALDGGSVLVGAPTFDDDRPGRGYLFDL